MDYTHLSVPFDKLTDHTFTECDYVTEIDEMRQFVAQRYVNCTSPQCM